MVDGDVGEVDGAGGLGRLYFVCVFNISIVIWICEGCYGRYMFKL